MKKLLVVVVALAACGGNKAKSGKSTTDKPVTAAAVSPLEKECDALLLHYREVIPGYQMDRDGFQAQCASYPADRRKCEQDAKDKQTLIDCDPDQKIESAEVLKAREQIKTRFQQLFDRVKRYHDNEGAVPVTDTGFMPKPFACKGKEPTPFEVDEDQWYERPWDDLNFGIWNPDFYSYRYVGTKTSVTIMATGDLDCDGTPNTLTRTATLKGGTWSAGEVVEEGASE